MVQWFNLGGLYLLRRGDFDPIPYGKIDVLEGGYPHVRRGMQMRDFLRRGGQRPRDQSWSPLPETHYGAKHFGLGQFMYPFGANYREAVRMRTIVVPLPDFEGTSRSIIWYSDLATGVGVSECNRVGESDMETKVALLDP